MNHSQGLHCIALLTLSCHTDNVRLTHCSHYEPPLAIVGVPTPCQVEHVTLLYAGGTSVALINVITLLPAIWQRTIGQ
jgi:hypothetical protein